MLIGTFMWFYWINENEKKELRAPIQWKSNVSTRERKNDHKFNRNLNEAWKSFKFYQLRSCGFVVLFNVCSVFEMHVQSEAHTWKYTYLKLPIWHINKWWAVGVKTTLVKNIERLSNGTFFFHPECHFSGVL